jgi:Family of unknown function (DUF6113)
VSRLTGLTYLALFLFGLAQGVVGSFYYGAGPAPLAALGFDVCILGTCLLGAWATQSAFGAFAPAVGWFIATFVLASGTSAGSVIITASSAGEWFLFGGAVAAMIGVVGGFTLWARRKPAASGPRK